MRGMKQRMSALILLAAGSLIHAGATQAAPAHPGARSCTVAEPGRVNYDDKLVRNPYVRRNLEALRCGLTAEGYSPDVVELEVSGGESYVGSAGLIYSNTNHSRIAPRNRRSAHNVENGARAVDVWRKPGISDREFRRVLARYTDFVSPVGHGRQHWHLRLPGREWDCPASVCTREPSMHRVSSPQDIPARQKRLAP